jgi:gliding motility-associated-like protein
MSENLKNIDQLFKQELGKTELQVPSGAWEAISSKAGIVSTSSVLAAKGMAWAKVLGVTLAVVTTIGVGVYVYKQEPVSKITQTQVPMEQPGVEDNKLVEISAEQESLSPNEVKPIDKQNIVSVEADKPMVKDEKTIEFQGPNQIVAPKLTLSPPNKRELVIVPVKNISATSNTEDVKNDFINAKPKQEVNIVQASRNEETKMLRLFPDVFTPNSDGTNDSFYVEIDKPEVFQLIVRTKQGVILFNTLDVNEKWDGKFNGIELPNGEFIASLVYQFGKTDRVITKTKTIELKRTE